jgi:hypothetical protein
MMQYYHIAVQQMKILLQFQQEIIEHDAENIAT